MFEIYAFLICPLIIRMIYFSFAVSYLSDLITLTQALNLFIKMN